MNRDNLIRAILTHTLQDATTVENAMTSAERLGEPYPAYRDATEMADHILHELAPQDATTTEEPEDPAALFQQWHDAITRVEDLTPHMKTLAAPYAEWLLALDPKAVLSETNDAKAYLAHAYYYDVEVELDIDDGTLVRLVRTYQYDNSDIFRVPIEWATDRDAHAATLRDKIEERTSRQQQEKQKKADAERATYERLKAKFEGES